MLILFAITWSNIDQVIVYKYKYMQIAAHSAIIHITQTADTHVKCALDIMQISFDNDDDSLRIDVSNSMLEIPIITLAVPENTKINILLNQGSVRLDDNCNACVNTHIKKILEYTHSNNVVCIPGELYL